MDDVPELGDALPLTATDPAWLPVALGDLDSVHADHLHCERKAAQSALSLIRSYPERGDLVTQMARLAHDETRHVVQVAQLMSRLSGPRATTTAMTTRRVLKHIRDARTRPCSIACWCSRSSSRSAERLGCSRMGSGSASSMRASTAEVRHRGVFLSLARDADPTRGVRAAARRDRDRVSRIAICRADLQRALARERRHGERGRFMPRWRRRAPRPHRRR
jgi:tRNA-(ms[2]io[6]A)-hydroxylase